MAAGTARPEDLAGELTRLAYDNAASRAVARGLALRQYAETFSLT